MYDCIIIGSGVVGATIARELSRYDLKVLIVEKEHDVALGATLANSAIVHSGHDPEPGTLKAKFNVLGNRMYKVMSNELDIPFLECGGLVVATSDEEVETLLKLYDRALINGLSDDEVKVITKEEARKLEPNLSDECIKALHLPTTSVTFPWEVAIANIENAMDNGVELILDSEVKDIKYDEYFRINTTLGNFNAKVIINAAGIHASNVSEMSNDKYFDITPRKGEYFVLDKDVELVNSVVYPVPSSKGKGVIVTPQVHGNVLLGPTSEFTDFNSVEKTSKVGLDFVRDNVSKLVKNVPYNKVIRTFAGSRATPNKGDFIIEDTGNGFINVAGIESPGLTASPAIAKHVVENLVSKRVKLIKDKNFNPIRKKVTRINELSIDDKNKIIQKDSRYGNIVCRCEGVSEGEIIESIRRNCGSRTVVGVKMRVRPGAGKCQGGFCQPEVVKILSKELNINQTSVEYKKEGSNILVSKAKRF